MKKKIVSILLICVILISVFAGCSSNGKTTTTNTTTEKSSSSTIENNNNDVTTADDLTATQPQSKPQPETTQPASDKLPDEFKGKKLIAITFDDGPSKYTGDLIKELNTRGAKATFFMVGNRVGQYPETVKLMSESGHELGSHTFNHSNIKKAPDDQVRSEMSQTDEALMGVTGQKAIVFRPPEGAFTAEKLALIDKPCIMWSVDPLDWKFRDAQAVYDKIIANSGDGSIILLHDLYPTSIAGGLKAIDALMAQGYAFVTVSQLLQRNNAKVANQTAYFSEKPAAV